jgi:hypothetical protein
MKNILFPVKMLFTVFLCLLNDRTGCQGFQESLKLRICQYGIMIKSCCQQPEMNHFLLRSIGSGKAGIPENEKYFVI